MMRMVGWKIAGVSALALAAGLSAGAVQADIVHADDVIITRSLCVGFDCVNNENFGADTIRLKENNLRIHFDDTSSAGGFANRDWRLIANDQFSGGRNIFYLEDSSAGREVFSVEAGAPSHSLYVDSGGRVGFGTSNPSTELHAVDGDTPTLRLAQDNSSGFSPQTWDVAGNETSFFIRDSTNGSTLPFRIRPGSFSNALVIHSTGDVGIGTLSPTAPLEVSRSSTPFIRLTDSGDNVAWAWQVQDTETRLTTAAGPGVEFALTTAGELKIPGPLSLTQAGAAWTALEDTSTGVTWNYQNNGGEARITTSSGPGVEFALATNGNLTISGEIFTDGSCSGGCDRVFEPDYDLRSIREHAKLMWTNGYLPAVGPTAEEGSMNLSAKVGGMLNELEHAHIYIAELEEQQARTQAELERQSQDNLELETRLARLEERLASR